MTKAQFCDMYGVVHKALMAYPVLRGREADIVNYGITTMDEGKTHPDPGSTPEPRCHFNARCNCLAADKAQMRVRLGTASGQRGRSNH